MRRLLALVSLAIVTAPIDAADDIKYQPRTDGRLHQLETQLTTAQTDSRRLFEAVLHETLAPAR